MEDRPKVRVGEAPRESSPFRAHPPVRPQADLRPTAFNLPEPARATPLAVPTPPPAAAGGGFSPADAGRGPVADGAPFENQTGGAGAVCCPSFGATPRSPARAGAAKAASARHPRARRNYRSLRGSRKSRRRRPDARRPNHAPEPPRAMSLTERLMQARGIQGAPGDACAAAKPGARALANISGFE